MKPDYRHKAEIKKEIKAIDDISKALSAWLLIHHSRPLSSDTLGLLAAISNLKDALFYRRNRLADTV